MKQIVEYLLSKYNNHKDLLYINMSCKDAIENVFYNYDIKEMTVETYLQSKPTENELFVTKYDNQNKKQCSAIRFKLKDIFYSVCFEENAITYINVRKGFKELIYRDEESIKNVINEINNQL